MEVSLIDYDYDPSPSLSSLGCEGLFVSYSYCSGSLAGNASSLRAS
jgi:hypothetical protein